MPARNKYALARPLQEVRLRDWQPTDVARFKRAIELLETELNKTIAAQVDQGGKRVPSNKLPIITGLTVRSGFKNFQLSFNPAKGIKDLLFYEIQKSTVSNFADDSITTYTIPQISLTIPAKVAFQETYFRVRVVNSKFQVGRWSNTVSSTARSFFRLESFNTGETTPVNIPGGEDPLPPIIVDITPAQFNTWVDIGSNTYSPSVASVCFQMHAGVQASCINHFTAGNGVAKQITNDTSVVFRITRADIPLREQMNVRAWGYQARSGAVPSRFTRYEHMVFSTLITGFESYDGTGPSITYKVQAKVLPETCSSDITSGIASTRTYDDNVRIILSFTSIFEVVQVAQ